MIESVALVMNVGTVDFIKYLAAKMPVWIRSDGRDAQVWRELRNSMPDASVTTFKSIENETKSGELIRLIFAVDEHHGSSSQSIPYRNLLVFGTRLRLPAYVLQELGFKSISYGDDCFSVSK
jgi:hypothetical protein